MVLYCEGFLHNASIANEVLNVEHNGGNSNQLFVVFYWLSVLHSG